LKTFFTQIRPALPLTPDPPVICFCKWIRWKDYEIPKNRILDSVSAKKLILFSPTPTLPACVYPPGPQYSENKIASLSLFPFPCSPVPGRAPARRRTRLRCRGLRGRAHGGEHAPPLSAPPPPPPRRRPASGTTPAR
jgi:hypothetical protein